MAVTGTIYLSGAGVVLLGGMYWRRGSSTGAFAALLSGLVAIAGLFVDQVNGVLSSILHREIALTGPHLGLFNFLFCALVFVVVSLLFPDTKGEKVSGEAS